MATEGFIEEVLRINPAIIIDKSSTLDYWLKDVRDLNKAVEYINLFHSYFHFEQSNLCLEASKICAYLGYHDKEQQYLEKAIFQDHINYEALARVSFLKGDSVSYQPNIPYNSYIKFESVYLERFIGAFFPSERILKLDQAIQFFDQGDAEGAAQLVVEMNEGLHRLLLLQAKISACNNRYELALNKVTEALRLIEQSHKAYHRAAAYVYKLRADEYQGKGQFDLAKNDLIKSKDLDPTL